ncbi:MAG: hypothetical protein WC972_04905 [Trueperaceae bacterium]
MDETKNASGAMKVRIVSTGGTGHGTRVMGSDGREIDWITGLTFRADVDDITRAEIEFSAVEIDAVAEAKFLVRGKEVRRIEYADGSADEFPA